MDFFSKSDQIQTHLNDLLVSSSIGGSEIKKIVTVRSYQARNLIKNLIQTAIYQTDANLRGRRQDVSGNLSAFQPLSGEGVQSISLNCKWGPF